MPTFRVAMLAAGHGHVLALGHNGSVWSWGANSAGQLGTGSLSERTLPAKVSLIYPLPFSCHAICLVCIFY